LIQTAAEHICVLCLYLTRKSFRFKFQSVTAMGKQFVFQKLVIVIAIAYFHSHDALNCKSDAHTALV